MPRYLHHFSYTTESVKAMVASPQNRRERAAQVIEAGGGKLLDLYFTFGKYDGVALTEFPSNADAASVALALGASGAFTKMHTTVLLTMEEATEAMQKAGSPAKTYHPPAS
jgi:uncharacterized protein with GYD domain